MLDGFMILAQQLWNKLLRLLVVVRRLARKALNKIVIHIMWAQDLPWHIVIVRIMHGQLKVFTTTNGTIVIIHLTKFH